MLKNDMLIQLVFRIKDAIVANDLTSVSQICNDVNIECTNDVSQNVVQEAIFNNGNSVNDAMIAIAQNINFLSSKTAKLKLLTLTKKLSDKTLTEEELMTEINSLDNLQGEDSDLREYFLMLLRACGQSSNTGGMPALRNKLIEIGVIK